MNRRLEVTLPLELPGRRRMTTISAVTAPRGETVQVEATTTPGATKAKKTYQLMLESVLGPASNDDVDGDTVEPAEWDPREHGLEDDGYEVLAVYDYDEEYDDNASDLPVFVYEEGITDKDDGNDSKMEARPRRVDERNLQLDEMIRRAKADHATLVARFDRDDDASGKDNVPPPTEIGNDDETSGQDNAKTSNEIEDKGEEPGGVVGSAAVPSPLTRSPVTFADLLPEVRKRATGQMPMADLVGAIMAAYECEVRRSPPSLKATHSNETQNDDPVGPQPSAWRAGMDVRRFRLAPDPPMGGPQQRQAPAGTEELRFRGPPDPVLGGWTRVVLTKKQGKPGTSVLGFQIPPDGGPWRTGMSVRRKASEAAGTEERRFRRPPDKGTRWDRLLMVLNFG